MKPESKIKEALGRAKAHFDPLPMYSASRNAGRAHAIGYGEGVDDALAWMLCQNPGFPYGEEADSERKEAKRRRDSAAKAKSTAA